MPFEPLIPQTREEYTMPEIKKVVARVCSNHYWKTDPNLKTRAEHIIANLRKGREKKAFSNGFYKDKL